MTREDTLIQLKAHAREADRNIANLLIYLRAVGNDVQHIRRHIAELEDK